MTSYDRGDRTRLSIQFTDINLTAADPTTVTVSVKPPGMSPLSYSYNLSPAIVVRTGIGAYYIDIDLAISGTWAWKWFGTGSLVVAEEGSLFVRLSRV